LICCSAHLYTLGNVGATLATSVDAILLANLPSVSNTSSSSSPRSLIPNASYRSACPTLVETRVPPAVLPYALSRSPGSRNVKCGNSASEMSDRMKVPVSLIPGARDVVPSLLNLVAPAELDASAANARLAGSSAGGVEKKGSPATAGNPVRGLPTAGDGCCTRMAGGEVGGDTMSNDEARLCVRTRPDPCAGEPSMSKSSSRRVDETCFVRVKRGWLGPCSYGRLTLRELGVAR